MILAHYQPKEVIALDASAEFVVHAQQSIPDAAAHFQVGLAQSLEMDSATIDATVSGLVLNFVPEPRAAIVEMLRVTKPGGKIGIFVWDYADGMKMLRHFWDAQGNLTPTPKHWTKVFVFRFAKQTTWNLSCARLACSR